MDLPSWAAPKDIDLDRPCAARVHHHIPGGNLIQNGRGQDTWPTSGPGFQQISGAGDFPAGFISLRRPGAGEQVERPEWISVFAGVGRKD